MWIVRYGIFPHIIRQSAVYDYADWVLCEVSDLMVCTNCQEHIRHQRLFNLQI